jgi:hypothetical protein
VSSKRVQRLRAKKKAPKILGAIFF